MNRVWRLVWAELTGRVRDKSFWLESVLLPVVVTLIMGFALGQVGRGETPSVRVGIVAPSTDTLAAQVLSVAFQATGAMEVQSFTDLTEARKVLNAGLDALVLVPDLDLADASRGDPLAATVESGWNSQFKAMMVAQVTEATLRSLAAELRARRAVAGIMSETGLDSTPAWTVPTPIPVSAHLEPQSLQRFDVLGAQLAGLAIFFSLLSAFRIMSSIFAPHRRGVNLRLASLPVRPAIVSAGYIITVATVAVLQTGMVLLLGRLVFAVQWGPTLPLVLATVLAAGASAAVALTLAVLPGSATTRGLVGMLVILGGSVLGGALVPIDGASPLLQLLARVTLHYWVTGVFTGLARGLALSDVGGMLTGVSLYGVTALVLATIFLSRRRPSSA